MARSAAHDVHFATIGRWFGAIAAAALVWWTAKVLLVLFASVLLAVFLRTAAEWLSDHSPLGERAALVVAGLVVLLTIAATGALLAPEISFQLDQLSERIPQAWHDLTARIATYSWGRRLVASPPPTGDPVTLVSNAGALLAMTMQSLAHFIVFLLAGIYLAADPRPYVAGVLWCVPAPRREHARRVLGRIGRVLRAWLLSRAAAMLIVAVMTTVGLWMLGMPLALTLGLAAGVATFVPYVGAIASAAPALLLASVQSPVLAGNVVILYVIVHVVEGYLVTPLIEQEAIQLPPAGSIAAQTILGTAFGLLGLMLASPLTASAILIAQSYAAEKEPAKAA